MIAKAGVRIGVVSDTHLKERDERLCHVLEEHFRDCDLILHAGDLVDPSVLALFGKRDVRAVFGNADPPEVRQILSDRIVVHLNGFRLGLIHDCEMSTVDGPGIPRGMGSVDCLVFGHTHRPVNFVSGGVLYFNPGSTTSNRISRYNSIGILEIGRTITGQIIELRDN